MKENDFSTIIQLEKKVRQVVFGMNAYIVLGPNINFWYIFTFFLGYYWYRCGAVVQYFLKIGYISNRLN